MLTYITYSQLAEDVQLLIKKLPRSLIMDLAGVVGIPRSGMLPATMVANHLHLPLTDCFSFVRCCGFTISGNRVTSLPEGKTVLVVDDSIYAGTTMAKTASILESAVYDSQRYIYSAVYRCPDRQASVDYYARDVAKPRYFQWNLMQHPDMPKFMLDMDGVLCYDPVINESDDPNFALTLKEAIPLHLPKYPAHSICTMRLERYRLITENWLRRHSVQYGNISMVNVPTVEERRKQIDYGKWKGEHYRESTAELFVESNSSQAISIAYYSRKPVICLANHVCYQENCSSVVGSEYTL